MIIKRKNYAKSSESAVVVKTTDGWKIECFGAEFKFKNSLVEYAPDIAHLSYSKQKNEFRLIWASDIREDKSAGFVQFLPPYSRDQICSFFIGADGSSSVCFNGIVRPEIGEGSITDDVIEEEKLFSSDKAFAKHITEAQAFVQRTDAKRILTRRINILDSLAMLEAQLDIVTRYILSSSDEEKATILTLLNTATTNNMTSTIHDDVKLTETVSRQKNYLRTLQKEYFKTRGDCENGKISA